jgi:hypothetical protein
MIYHVVLIMGGFMKLRRLFAAAFLSLLLANNAPAVFAQSNGSSVSVVTLRTTTGQNGQQMVVAPSQQLLPLPGAGVNGNSVDIYIGAQGGYWYVDRNGQNFDLTPYVQSMNVSTGTNTYSSSNSSNNNSSGNSSGNGNSNNGSNYGETAAAAGLGAMAGAAAGTAYSDYNNQYSVPYGVAVFSGGGQPYYTGANGANVNLSNTSSATINAYGNNLAQQERWYAQQQQANPQRFQQWQGAKSHHNPFVARSNSPGASEAASSFRSHGGPGGGPFARREGSVDPSAAGGGGPFHGNRPSGGPFSKGVPGGEPGAGGNMPTGGPFGGGRGPSGGPFAGGGGMPGGGSMPSGGPPMMRGGGGGIPSGGPPMGGGFPGPGPH